jgi:hypothetical protein
LIIDDGRLDFREFLCCLTLLLNPSPHIKLRLIFEVFDQDQDGFLSRDEASAMARCVLRCTPLTLGKAAEKAAGVRDAEAAGWDVVDDEDEDAQPKIVAPPTPRRSPARVLTSPSTLSPLDLDAAVPTISIAGGGGHHRAPSVPNSPMQLTAPSPLQVAVSPLGIAVPSFSLDPNVQASRWVTELFRRAATVTTHFCYFLLSAF